LAAGLLAAFSVNAHSTDLLEPVGNDWQGFYAGLHLGGIDADFKNNLPTSPGPFGDAGSVIGGAQAGYNIQSGNFVFGGEADVSFMDIDAKSAAGRFEEDWMATFRVRGGMTFDRWLVYGTVGLALTEKHTRLTGFGSSTRMESGVTAGGGVEMKFSETWSARAEALYVNVPKDNQTVGGVTTVGGSDNVIYRGGINFHF